jgi:hypothetical protein
VTITGIITGTPPGTGETRQVEQKVNGRTYQFAVSAPDTNAVTRLEAARDTLYRLRNQGELIAVVTGLKSYENMAIKSLSITRDATISLRFTATLVQVKVVELATTRLRAANTSANIAKPQEKDGKKPGKKGPEQTALKKLGIGLGTAAGKLWGAP